MTGMLSELCVGCMIWTNLVSFVVSVIPCDFGFEGGCGFGVLRVLELAFGVACLPAGRL